MVAASQVLTSNARLTEALWWMSVKQLIQPMHESDGRRKSRLHENMVRSSRSSTKEKMLNYTLMNVEKTSSLFTWTLKQGPQQRAAHITATIITTMLGEWATTVYTNQLDVINDPVWPSVSSDAIWWMVVPLANDDPILDQITSNMFLWYIERK